MSSAVAMSGDFRTWSKYWDAFQALEKVPDALTLLGDTILIERAPPEERDTHSGITIATEVSTHKDTMEDGATNFGLVLAVGPGYYDDDGDVPLSVRPGDIVLVDPLAVNWYSQFGGIARYKPYAIGMINQQQLRVIFKDYQKTFKVLNENIKL
ncbi:MAG: hypothetical protein NVS9B9_08640 [Ktedonobacteraceae bacterium]